LGKIWDKNKNIYNVERRIGKEKERIGGKRRTKGAKKDKNIIKRKESG
jgi:hypothetical protein